MTSFFSFLAKKKFPRADDRESILSGPFTASKAIIYVLFFAILAIAFTILVTINDRFLVTAPAHGGTLTEGVIGSPRFINPILAATETDSALSHLVYAGLMKETPDGTILPELAESYTVSPDGRAYTFTLKSKLLFHDGTPVTSSDVAFTLEKLRDNTLNTRSAYYWQNVHAETPDQHTVVLTLLNPDTAFLKKMTVGILPAARWQGIVDEAFVDPSLNLSPVGAGAFKFENITYDENGAPKTISFVRNKNYALGSPYLAGITVSIFTNQETLQSALKNGSIDFSFVVNPTTLSAGKVPNIAVSSIPTDTTIELIRRSDEPVFQNPTFLAAISQYIDKNKIVDTVENGYGIPTTESVVSPDETIATLARLGYVFTDGTLKKGATPVTISLAIENEPELVATGKILTEQLQAIGITVSTEVYERGSFQEGLDHGAFTIALVDSDTAIGSVYVSGIPLYTKSILITTRAPAKGMNYETLPSTTMRYSDVQDWFTKTDRVWEFLKTKQ